MIKSLNVLAMSLKFNARYHITPSRLISASAPLQRNLDNRAQPPYMYPSHKHNRWVVTKPVWDRPYTIEAIPYPRTGGRGPNGRIWNHKRGGGLKKIYHMVDMHRCNSPIVPAMEGDVLVERVLNIKKDDVRSAMIALVGSGETKRYIMATENMRVGDIIRSSKKLSKTPIRPKEGDSHPVGSLPIGSVVSCVEKILGEGARVAISAGTSAYLLRKYADEDGKQWCVLKMPSKREIIVADQCLVTVGRMSNILHNKKKFRKFGEKRWLGIRPRSGRWHRKTGKHGRKIKPIKPPMMYNNEFLDRQKDTFFTLPTRPGCYSFKSF